MQSMLFGALVSIIATGVLGLPVPDSMQNNSQNVIKAVYNVFNPAVVDGGLSAVTRGNYSDNQTTSAAGKLTDNIETKKLDGKFEKEFVKGYSTNDRTHRDEMIQQIKDLDGEQTDVTLGPEMLPLFQKFVKGYSTNDRTHRDEMIQQVEDRLKDFDVEQTDVTLGPEMLPLFQENGVEFGPEKLLQSLGRRIQFRLQAEMKAIGFEVTLLTYEVEVKSYIPDYDYYNAELFSSHNSYFPWEATTVQPITQAPGIDPNEMHVAISGLKENNTIPPGEQAQFSNPDSLIFVLDYYYNRVIFRFLGDMIMCYILPMMKDVPSLEDWKEEVHESSLRQFKTKSKAIPIAAKVVPTNSDIFLLPLSSKVCGFRHINLLEETTDPWMEVMRYGSLQLPYQEYIIYLMI